ncbi:MAG: hypothetical protein Q4A01_10110, partial [Coriobacteriales bacterium]|nr:hypothetical protein [Coriobacteriales bacterium]
VASVLACLKLAMRFGIHEAGIADAFAKKGVAQSAAKVYKRREGTGRARLEEPNGVIGGGARAPHE